MNRLKRITFQVDKKVIGIILKKGITDINTIRAWEERVRNIIVYFRDSIKGFSEERSILITPAESSWAKLLATSMRGRKKKSAIERRRALSPV